MTDFGKILFNLQRYEILMTKINPQTRDALPNDYVWVGLYPFFHDNEWSEDLKEYFNINEEKVSKVLKYLDREWLNKKYYVK
jgi:hypothetical protein